MRQIYKIFLILLLTSCSASHHIQKIQKHKHRAIEKGAIFEDSIQYKYKFKTDTIVDTLNNTVNIYTTVLDSFPYIVSKPVYVPMTRVEYRDRKNERKTDLKHAKIDFRKYKKEAKLIRKKLQNERVEIRKKYGWKNWIIIVLFGGLVFCVYLLRRKTF